MPCGGNDALRTLELGYNPIKEKGAQALADVVKYDLQVRGIAKLSRMGF